MYVIPLIIVFHFIMLLQQHSFWWLCMFEGIIISIYVYIKLFILYLFILDSYILIIITLTSFFIRLFTFLSCLLLYIIICYYIGFMSLPLYLFSRFYCYLYYWVHFLYRFVKVYYLCLLGFIIFINYYLTIIPSIGDC